jgi:hypothetical protein
MKNLLSQLKAVKTGTHKAEVRAGSGAGAETICFGSATLCKTVNYASSMYCENCSFVLKI